MAERQKTELISLGEFARIGADGRPREVQR